jgi:hypothetical protein
MAEHDEIIIMKAGGLPVQLFVNDPGLFSIHLPPFAADRFLDLTPVDPFLRCELPGQELQVDIQLVALSLTSAQPITVNFNGPFEVSVPDVAEFVNFQGNEIVPIFLPGEPYQVQIDFALNTNHPPLVIPAPPLIDPGPPSGAARFDVHFPVQIGTPAALSYFMHVRPIGADQFGNPVPQLIVPGTLQSQLLGPNQLRISYQAQSANAIHGLQHEVFVNAGAQNVPPRCETLPGDMNNDAEVSGLDVNLFVQAVVQSLDVNEAPCADMDGNGVIDPADVPLFVAALLN